LFNHNFLKPINLTEKYIDGKRHYVTEDGNSYPSVTTVLSSVADKTGLIEWQNKVGPEKAEIIKSQAARRGTNLHKICEDYVLNVPEYAKGHMPSTVSLFKQIQPFLDRNIEDVYGIEIPLYSDVLKTAGRCDMVCKMKGKDVIVDYKTSSKPKKEEWIDNYFLQLTTYALMIEERYNKPIPNIVVLIAIEQESTQYDLQVFVKKTSEYKDRVHDIFLNYGKELM
jgi:hypothetical protein